MSDMENKFKRLRQSLETGIPYFADLRPPRYSYQRQCWIVARHTGSETIEHTFDTETEAQAFYTNPNGELQ